MIRRFDSLGRLKRKPKIKQPPILPTIHKVRTPKQKMLARHAHTKCPFKVLDYIGKSLLNPNYSFPSPPSRSRRR